MSNKHIMNAGICCICTAVIFGLHFFVYGRMLLDNPVLDWRYLRCFYCISRRAHRRGTRTMVSA